MNSKLTVLELDKTGDLQNAYTPLHNLVNETTHQIGDFTSSKLKFDRDTPIELSIVDEYDGSTNIIINDDQNTPKLINNRFSVQENKTFEIPIHYGNAVTNIYNEATLQEDTQLIKLYNKIPNLQYLGLVQGGSFKCGSYVFYFKLSDADGNLSNIVQESGIVQVHIGEPNTKKIRMGFQDENSEKCIRFRLTNLDSTFDYVKVYYERCSTDESQAALNQYYFINQNFPIINSTCDLLLTGSEETIQIDKYELQTEFADISTAKTQAIVDNTLFLGNVSSYEQNFNELQKIAWKIIPRAIYEEDLGFIEARNYSSDTGLYYNTKNSYYYTGYFNEELYRFGVVFIYNNNLLSPVFNIQGCDLTRDILDSDFFEDIGEPQNDIKEQWINQIGNTLVLKHYTERSVDPNDGFFNKEKFMNSKGVVRVYNKEYTPFETRAQQQISHKPLGIKFDLTYLGTKDGFNEEGSSDYIREYTENGFIVNRDSYKVLKDLNIKGLFFVRQKRIPTIISQGVVIGLTGRKNGAIPVIQNKSGEWITKSFLSKQRLLVKEGSTVTIKSEVTNNALLIPDYEVNKATLNQLFNGSKFQLQKVGNIQFSDHKDYFYCNLFNKEKDQKVENDITLTAVQTDTKITTDGEYYFSSLAGNPSEPYKTEDVNYVWNKTAPQDLTVSTSLIRGKWGSYVGIGKNGFEYGDIVNIRLNNTNTFEDDYLAFQKRFNDNSLYSAISPRMELSSIFTSKIVGEDYVICYRGDCFMNLFTHRMMTNFIDPELPTNTEIIDPSCWAKNYAVRCTAEILQQTHSNLTSDSDGWYIPSPPNTKSNVVSLIFGILTGNIGTIIQSIKQLANVNDANKSQLEYANEVAQAFELYIGKGSDEIAAIPETPEDAQNTQIEELVKNGWIKKVNPKEQEQQGFSLKAIFKSDDDWELHGLASINRADVNAVSFGQWITFPIMSSYNLALRDIDFTQATEEAAHRRKRSFYPLQEMNIYDHLLESDKINGATKRSLSSNGRPAYKTVPFIKEEFFNRIYWSKPNITQQFVNSYRLIFSTQFKEYNKEFGSITKLLPLGNSLAVIFEHGIGILPINRQPQTDAEASPWLSQTSVLPSQVSIVTRDYGSMWKDSVIQTPNGFIYGVDTVAKKIWRLHPNGQQLEFISDFKVQKFLNDHITLSEYDYKEYLGHINVKTHYNAFKKDVMFTYYRDIPYIVKTDSNGNEVKYYQDIYSTEVDEFGNRTRVKNTKDYKWERSEYWNLCFNETIGEFITFYSWIPSLSCNIDNIYFSFNRDEIDSTLDKVNQTQSFIQLNNDYSIENKYSIDNAFTNNITIYNIPKGSISIPVSGGNYLSFYASNNNLTINGLAPQNIYITSGKWYFIVYDVTSEVNVTIQFNDDTRIGELKFSTISRDAVAESLNSNWQYMPLREAEQNKMFLWKHGQAGLYDNQGLIKPTNWYGKQHEWAFEFVVNETPQMHKIFNNLMIISNKAAPYKFEYEVVGEAYDWYIYKPVIAWINKHAVNGNLDAQYLYVLSNSYGNLRKNNIDFPELFGFSSNDYIKKLPYLKLELTDYDGMYAENEDYWTSHGITGDHSLNSSETALIEDSQLNEFKVHTESKANDMKKYGRLRGNMEYLEDLWKIEIRPINFKYAYIQNEELAFSKIQETRHRDKFIRIKVRYDGKDLALIQAISTLFDYSFA